MDVIIHVGRGKEELRERGGGDKSMVEGGGEGCGCAPSRCLTLAYVTRQTPRPLNSSDRKGAKTSERGGEDRASDLGTGVHLAGRRVPGQWLGVNRASITAFFLFFTCRRPGLTFCV